MTTDEDISFIEFVDCSAQEKPNTFYVNAECGTFGKIWCQEKRCDDTDPENIKYKLVDVITFHWTLKTGYDIFSSQVLRFL